MRYWLRNALSLMVLGHISPALSQGTETTAAYDQAVFGFAGLLTRDDMQRSANVFGVDYENRPIFGFGYQKFLFRQEHFAFGLEGGAAARFGPRFSAEAWGGAVMRYDGFTIADRLTISPAFTAGLSAVSRTHPGREQHLEDHYDGNAKLLFYLGPEINLSLPAYPGKEVFWRLHHRSGGGKTLGDMKGAANANVVGLRYRF